MESERTRIIAVDDDPAIIRLLRGLEDFGFAVCGIARVPEEALHMLRTKRPQAALVEIALERSEDLPLIQSIRSEFPNVGVVVFTHLPEALHAENALHAGALGFVSKSAPQGELQRALRAVRGQQAYFSTRTMTRLITEMARSRHSRALRKLTGRETQVFERLCEGRDLDAIASELELSRKTVEVYRRRAIEKLALGSVSDLEEFIRRWNLGDQDVRSEDVQRT